MRRELRVGAILLLAVGQPLSCGPASEAGPHQLKNAEGQGVAEEDLGDKDLVFHMSSTVRIEGRLSPRADGDVQVDLKLIINNPSESLMVEYEFQRIEAPDETQALDLFNQDRHMYSLGPEESFSWGKLLESRVGVENNMWVLRVLGAAEED
jgi:hypothetical protein